MKRIIQTIILTLITLNSFALGLRSMVAVPIAEGDFVFRMMNNSLNKPYMDALGFGLAYGLPNDGALFIGMPYRLTPAGPNRTGNVSALYRYIIKREDRKDGTFRVGLLGGGLIPSNNASDGGAQLGAVATYFKDRDQIDATLVGAAGFGKSRNTVRYDLSWQRRLAPLVFPEWGLPVSLQSVLEYNGRVMETSHLIHQVTAGLQMVTANVIIEGGVYKDLNKPSRTGVIVGFRARG